MEVLQAKHPKSHPDLQLQPQLFKESLAFVVSAEMVQKSILSFPNGSIGGPDGLRPQHLKDLVGHSSGDGAQCLVNALIGFITLVLEGRTPESIRPYLFGALLTALIKKDGGLRPIAVGSTLRRLVAKCACFQARDSMTELLPPHQLGFGVSQGAECAVHAARFFANNLGPHQALVKVDFRNAFNCVRRDKVMAAIEEFLPSLLPFLHSAYSSSSKLFREDAEVISAEGVQQGDPIGPLLFCITIHKMVLQIQTAFNVWYLDDGTLGGGEEELLSALKTIQQEGAQLGLHLNVHKCELICHDPSTMEFLSSSEDCGSILCYSPGLTAWQCYCLAFVPCVQGSSAKVNQRPSMSSGITRCAHFAQTRFSHTETSSYSAQFTSLSFFSFGIVR